MESSVSLQGSLPRSKVNSHACEPALAPSTSEPATAMDSPSGDHVSAATELRLLEICSISPPNAFAK